MAIEEQDLGASTETGGFTQAEQIQKLAEAGHRESETGVKIDASTADLAQAEREASIQAAKEKVAQSAAVLRVAEGEILESKGRAKMAEEAGAHNRLMQDPVKRELHDTAKEPGPTGLNRLRHPLKSLRQILNKRERDQR